MTDDEATRRTLWHSARHATELLERESRHSDDFAYYSQQIGWLKLHIEKLQPHAPEDTRSQLETAVWLVEFWELRYKLASSTTGSAN